MTPPRVHSGQAYHLPANLTAFQRKLYLHLIQWKWKHITVEPGHNRHAVNDATLPLSVQGDWPHLYPHVKPGLKDHLARFPFRIHKFFHHMASSQAANINLFLPLLIHPQADAVFRFLNPRFSRLAREYLDQGFRIEFWDEPFGRLGDKTRVSGTDADIAIAYYNHEDELCLWLIEHKLSETEFTACGGFKSRGRGPGHDCSRSFAELLERKSACYYHDASRFNYWVLTEAHRSFFPGAQTHRSCPFQGGMNQLWRNQLLALSIEADARQPYRFAEFSVVKHAGNTSLDETLKAYRELVGGSERFSVFTSEAVVQAAEAQGDAVLNLWVEWYRGLYAPSMKATH